MSIYFDFKSIDELTRNNYNMNNFRFSIPIDRQINQDTSNFTPNDWIRYSTPLVTYALRETTQGMNTQHLYRKLVLLGILVGLGRTPQEAMDQVQEWENTGATQLLQSDMEFNGTMTPGGIDTTGNISGAGTTGSIGTTDGVSDTGTTGGIDVGDTGTPDSVGVGGTDTPTGIGVGGTVPGPNTFNRLYFD